MDGREKSDTERHKLRDRTTILMKSSKMKGSKRRNTRNLLVLIILCFATFLLIGNNIGFTEVETVEYNSLKKNNTKITFTGDVSPSRYLKEISKKYGHDIYYQDIKSIWEDSDISLINLEAAVLAQNPDKGEYIKADKPANIYLDVNQEDVKAIKDSGIDLIGFANNHSTDYGIQGVQESLEIFKNENIEHIGVGRNIHEAIRPYTKRIDDQNIAIMAVTDSIVKGALATNNMPGINTTRYWHSDYELERMIEKNDFNIVFIHWGTEYAINPDKEIQKLGRKLIDMGVDLVVGSHPHVLLPVEKYNDGMIVYSLGNLVFDQKNGRTTDSAIGNLYLGENEKYFEFVPIDIKNGVPYKTDNKRNIKRIFNTLTRELDKDNYEIKDEKLIINF